jgi:hypothetical protein
MFIRREDGKQLMEEQESSTSDNMNIVRKDTKICYKLYIMLWGPTTVQQALSNRRSHT